MKIEKSINKFLNQVYFKILHSGNVNGPDGGLSVRSDVTCHKCVKKIHIKRCCKSNVNGSIGDSYHKPKV